jgi:hypothetical protein
LFRLAAIGPELNLVGNHLAYNQYMRITFKSKRMILSVASGVFVYSVSIARKFLILLLDAVISLLLYFSAKYAGLSGAEDIRVVIGVLQLPVTAIIVAISVEDSAGMFLADEKKREGAS